MNYETAIVFGIALVGLLWLAGPFKPKPKPKKNHGVPYWRLTDQTGYYVLEGESGKRSIALPKRFEFISGARQAISDTNDTHFNKPLHVGYWNGEEWEAYYEA